MPRIASCSASPRGLATRHAALVAKRRRHRSRSKSSNSNARPSPRRWSRRAGRWRRPPTGCRSAKRRSTRRSSGTASRTEATPAKTARRRRADGWAGGFSASGGAQCLREQLIELRELRLADIALQNLAVLVDQECGRRELHVAELLGGGAVVHGDLERQLAG